jgi:hypothetical protein
MSEQSEHRRSSVLRQPSFDPTEIVITQTKLPVLRAGLRLLILPISAILGVLLYMFGRDASQSQIIGGVMAAFGVILGLLYFAAVAARIYIENGAVRILRSLDDVVIPSASIRDWSVRALSIWRSIVVCIWRKEGRWPVVVHFVVADTTNAGDLHPTAAALKQLLSDGLS